MGLGGAYKGALRGVSGGLGGAYQGAGRVISGSGGGYHVVPLFNEINGESQCRELLGELIRKQCLMMRSLRSNGIGNKFK